MDGSNAAKPGKRAAAESTASSGTRTVNLALQGGGAHGAFTWGVLDQLLDDERIIVEGLSATSAGAMNAAVFTYGYAMGGRAGAKTALAQFWRRISEAAMRGPLQPSWLDRIMGNRSLEFSPAFVFADLMTRLFSPYEFNVFDVNPLRDVLEATVDFAALREHSCPIKLFLSATNVRTGKVRVFERTEICADRVLASGCLPFLFRAVEIEGEHYWDGGLISNTPLNWVFEHGQGQDTLAFQVDLWSARGEFPGDLAEVAARQKEIQYTRAGRAQTRTSSSGCNECDARSRPFWRSCPTI